MPNWKKVIVSGSDATLNSLNVVSGSILSGSITATGSFNLNGNQTITGSLTVITGSLIEFQVTNTGTKIGNVITDTHTVTGSLNISGSTTATSFTGSLFGTASYATNALTASFALNGGGGGLSALYIQDEGVTQGTASYINFTGTGVTATVTSGTASISITGGSSGTGQSVVHTQASPATTWTFSHNLNSQYLVYDVYDSNSNAIIPANVSASNANTLIITFGVATAGYAVATVGGGLPFISASFNGYVLTASGSTAAWAPTSSLSVLSASYATTASFVTLAQTASYVTTAQTASFVATASYANNADLLDGLNSTIFATTGSNTFVGTQTITGSILQSGSFTSTGTITAQTLVVQTITSSIVYSSGSNIFGNSLANTQTFTGSVNITGSLAVNGTSSIIGTGTSGQVAYFNGTSSITSNAAFAFTPTSQLLINNSVTAASLIARGTNITPTLSAAANNDVLVGLDINPTFNTGSFTGVTNYALRANGLSYFTGPNYGSFTINAASYPVLTWASNGTNFGYIGSGLITGGATTDLGIRSTGVLQFAAGATATAALTITSATAISSPALITLSRNAAAMFLDSSLGNAIVYNISGTGYGGVGSANTLLTGGTSNVMALQGTNGIQFIAGGVAATNLSAQIFASTGNLLIQRGGTFTDAGFRFDVSGSTRITNNLTVSGSTILTGSLTLIGNEIITGSSTATLGYTGSLFGTSSYASNALTASYALVATSASYAATASFVTTAQTASFVATASYANNATTSSYALTATSASYASASTTASYALTATSASFASNAAQAQTASYVVLAQTASFVTTAQTASFVATASYASNANLLDGLDSTVFATTGSNTFIGTQTVTGSILQSGSFTSTGTITAQTLVVQTITSSVVFSSGSNIFGNSLANTQTLTGSVSITGSLAVNGSSVILTNQTSSMSASYALTSTSASFASNAAQAQTSSYVVTAQTASFVTTAQTASFVVTAQTASFVTTAQTASYVVTAQTASYATNFTISGSLTITSASFNYQQNLTVATGSYTTIVSVNTGSYRCAFFDYVTYSGSVVRAGTLQTTWSGSVTSYNEAYTADLGGSTSIVTLQTAISGSNIELQAGISGSAWAVRSLVRLL